MDLTDLKSGDVVIRRMETAPAIRLYATVVDDGVMPSDWQTGGVPDAEKWAADTVATTGGVIYRLDD